MDAKWLKDGTVTAAKLAATFLATLLRSDSAVQWLVAQNAGNQRLTNLGAPVAATDAARLKDVQERPYKEACFVCTTANISLTGANQTVDGEVVPAGKRVCVAFQTNQSQNGLYLVPASGAWERTADADEPADFRGIRVPIEKGTLYGNHVFACNVDDVVVGTTPLPMIDLGESTPPAFPTVLNKDMTALVTSGDGQKATNTTLARTPAKGSYIRAFVGTPNAAKIGMAIGDGVKTKAFYLSADAGATAKTFATAAQGDELYFNTSIGGAPLAATDAIDLDYLVTG